MSTLHNQIFSLTFWTNKKNIGGFKNFCHYQKDETDIGYSLLSQNIQRDYIDDQAFKSLQPEKNTFSYYPKNKYEEQCIQSFNHSSKLLMLLVFLVFICEIIEIKISNQSFAMLFKLY